MAGDGSIQRHLERSDIASLKMRMSNTRQTGHGALTVAESGSERRRVQSDLLYYLYCKCIVNL